MRRRSVVLAASSALLLAAGPALAGDKGFPVVPSTYDPMHLGTITAQWETHVGLPDSGNSDHALHFAKAGTTADPAAAFAELKKAQGTTIPATVSYWIPVDGPNSYCGAGAPRWQIYVVGDPVAHFIGCSSGDETATATDSRGQEWKQLTWRTNDPMQTYPIIPPGSVADAVYLAHDEAGSTLVDNINYIYTMGKPGNGS